MIIEIILSLIIILLLYNTYNLFKKNEAYEDTLDFYEYWIENFTSIIDETRKLRVGRELNNGYRTANFPIYNRAAEYISSSLTPWASGENRTVVPGVTVRETGGAVYVVAIQSIKFDLEPGMEDRYRFQMQFITEYRKDFKF